MNTTTSHRYRLHGLVIDSSIPLPELRPAAADGPADVTIEEGRTPAALDRPLKAGGCFQSEPGRFLIWLDGEARFLVSEGRVIRVEPETGASAATIRRLLLSSPFGALLLQRGLLSFHASAVVVDGAGILLVGGPCAGKSTLAARFMAEGYRVLSDDITAVRFDDAGTPWFEAGFPELKLWPDAVVALGREAAGLPNIGADLKKKILRIPEAFDPGPVRLRAVYLLGADPTSEVRFERIEGARRAAGLLNQTYRSAFVSGATAQRALFREVARLAESVRLTSVARPDAGFFDREIVRGIIEDMKR